MRPDAHKKKASQAYKKKHGLAGDKKPAAEGGKGGGRKAKEEPSAGERSSAREAGKLAPGKTNDAPSTSGVTDTSLATQFGYTSFKKRQVQSNWDRYEGLEAGEDEDQMTQRGADFGLLLNVTTDSLSQFRFADEQDWEEDPPESGGVLSIDCAGVAAALRCIPLDVQLGISEDYFTTEQLELFKTSARNHLQSYKEQINSAKPQLEGIGVEMWESDGTDDDEGGLLFSDEPTVTSPSLRDAIEMKKPRNEERKKTKSMKKTVIKRNESQHSAPEGISCHVENDERALLKTEGKSEAASAEATEDDLDMLLGIGTPVNHPKIEEDLEDLLDDVPVKEENPVPDMSAAAVASPNVPSSTTNLENWLDDFLDD